MSNSSSDARIRVAIICPQPLVSIGVANVCQEDPRLSLVHDLSSLSGAGQYLAPHKPHVTLIDWDAIPQNFESAGEVRDLSQFSRVLFLMDKSDSATRDRACELGARGVLPKTTAASTVRDAIWKVAAGGTWLEHAPEPPTSAAVPVASEQSVRRAIEGLTRRERQIVELVCKGLRNRHIARELKISETTVCHHLTSIFNKLQVEDRVGLFIFAHRNGMEAAKRDQSQPSAWRTPELRSRGAVTADTEYRAVADVARA